MRWMLQYRANKCVFKKVCGSCLWWHSDLTGNEFQVDGPATEKARRPYVCNRWSWSTRSRRLADLRCCREATSETGRQRSTKYCGAWPSRQLCTMMQLVTSLARAHWASAVQCAVMRVSFHQTCECHTWRATASSLVEVCQCFTLVPEFSGCQVK